MEELLPRLFLGGSDCALCYAILKVSIHATVGNALAILIAVILEGIVSKTAIVAVVVLDSDTMLLRPSLKSFLGFHCLFRCEICGHEESEPHSGKMVDEDGGPLVALLGKPSLHLGKESQLGADHLIDGDTLARYHCFEDFRFVVLVLLGYLGAPGNLCHCTVEATSTSWWSNLGKVFGDFSHKSQLLELAKGQVPQTIVPSK
jgi:hypothetical protein